ncbi:MAG: hypothetical protein HYT71_02205 [Candidatus Aenigmarchaeota archaeon]|nr:hypothetical protein [Candidatus Aenigmarchaeota archaeon]
MIKNYGKSLNLIISVFAILGTLINVPYAGADGDPTCDNGPSLGSLSPGGSVSGDTYDPLTADDPDDWFYFITGGSGNQPVTLKLTSPPSSDFDAYIYLNTEGCASHTSVRSCTQSPPPSPEVCPAFTPTVNSVYDVKIHRYSGSGEGTFTISMAAAPAGDTTAPSAGSISINSGDTYTGSTSVTLTLSCTDNVACTSMRFANSADCSSAAWEAYSTSKSWTLVSGDGSKTVCAQFKDAAGNAGSTYTDTITLDTTNPSGSILPTSCLIKSGGSCTLTLSGSDIYKVDWLRFYGGGIDEWGGNAADGVPCASTSCSRTRSVSPASTTTYNLDVWDGASHHVTYSSTVTVDSTNPSISSFTSTPSSPITQGTSITFTITASDNIGLSKLQVYNPDTGARVDSASCSAATSCTKAIIITPSSTGSKTYIAYAVDSAGNEFTYGTTIAYTVNAADTTPPSISGGSPSGVVDSGTITMSVTTDENANCKYSTTAGTAYDSMESTFSTGQGTKSHSTSLGSLGSGLHNRYVRCADTAPTPNKNIADYTVSFTANDAPVIGTKELRSTVDSRDILLNPDIASGNSLNVYISATDDRGIDYIQYIDQSGSPSESLSCVSGGVYPTSCTKTFATITPTTASHSYSVIVRDKDGRNALATIGPINVVNSCANWVCPALSSGDTTSGLPSISDAQYVNYMNCASTCTCPAGKYIQVTESGSTETNRDFFSLGGACAGVYDPVSGSFGPLLFNSCGTQSADLKFISDYSVHSGSLSTTKISCVSPPVRSSLSPSPGSYVGSQSQTLSLTTDKAATCRYSTSSGVDYDSMTNTFSGGGTISHSIGVNTGADGTFHYYLRCKDTAGIKNLDDSDLWFVVDTSVPATTDDVSAGWYQGDATITITCTDAGSLCWQIFTCKPGIGCTPALKADGLAASPASTTETLTTTGDVVRYYSKNNAQLVESTKTSSAVKIDKIKPTSTWHADTPADGSWVNKNGFTIKVVDADTGGSNLKDCKYRVNSGASGWTVGGGGSDPAMAGACSGSSSTVTKLITVGSSGDCRDQSSTAVCQVQVYAADNAGWKNDVDDGNGNDGTGLQYRNYKVDYTDPITSAKVSGTSSETFDVTWPTSLDYPLIGASGLKQIDFDVKINAGSWSFWSSCQSSQNAVGQCWNTGKLSYTGTAGNTYAFRARGFDVAGNDEAVHASADSTTKVVSLPGLQYPSPSGSDIFTVTPTLDWSVSTGANCYGITVGEGANPLDINKCSDTSCTGYVAAEWPSTTSYAVPNDILSYGKTYTWKIFASADNCASYRSPATWSFNTKIPAPSLTSPGDLTTTSPAPTLSWDAVSGADCYQVNVIRSSDSAVMIAGDNSNTNSYTVAPGVLGQGVEYKWKVKSSIDGCNTFGPFSTQWRFTTGGVCADITKPCKIEWTKISNNLDFSISPTHAASLVTATAPAYWYVDLPPPSNYGAQFNSYALGAGPSPLLSPDVTAKIGTTAGGAEVCQASPDLPCTEGVAGNARYYITLTSSGTANNRRPVGTAELWECGTAAAISDTISVGSCTVTATNLAKDVSDGSSGRYKDLGVSSNTRTIQFDDKLSGGCDMDLKFSNQWTTNVGGISTLMSMFNMKLDKDAGNDISFGYKLESPSCVFVLGAPGTCFDEGAGEGGSCNPAQNNPDGYNSNCAAADENRPYCSTTLSKCGGDCHKDPQVSADKKSVTWVQLAKKNGLIGGASPNTDRAQATYNYNVWECNPGDNTNAAGYNNFCATKNSNAPYCDPKCTLCSIVNNNPATSGNPNALDCPAGSTAKGWIDNPADPNDQLIVGKCNLLAGATKGGSCQYFTSCTFNTDCSTACCSRESIINTGYPGPGEGTGKCVTPFSAGNPINPYLCRSS